MLGRGPSSDSDGTPEPRGSRQSRAALGLAEQRGVPVFPCRPSDKGPCWIKDVLEHGHLDATTDPERVRAFWRRFPDALIGVPVGSVTGRFVVDLDVRPEKDGFGELAKLEKEHGPLPKTRTFRTPSGGEHRHYKHPGFKVKNRTGKSALGPGLEIKGDGGYVIVPPSTGYEVIDRSEVAEAPAWLLDMLKEKEPPGREPGAVGSAKRTTKGARGFQRPPPGSIPEGERNCALYALAYDKRLSGRGEVEVLEYLLDVNSSRCEPPLSEPEVRKIARSASGRPIRRETPPDVLAALEGLERAWWRPGRGRGAKTEKSLMRALLLLARLYGTMIPAGIRFPASVREVGLLAGCRAATVSAVTKRLRKARVLRKDDAGRRGAEAGAWVLLVPHTGTPGSGTLGPGRAPNRNSRAPTESLTSTGPTSVTVARAPSAKLNGLLTPHCRWGAGRLGKSKEELLCVLEAYGEQTDAQLAALLDVARVRDLHRRHIRPLVEKDVIERSGDKNRLTDDWLERLQKLRKANGEMEADRLDAERYRKARVRYQSFLDHTIGDEEA